MSNEPGGRSKSGDTYEKKYVLRQIIEVLREEIDYVNHEPLGNDADAVDCIVGKKDGSRELQQCKSRNRNSNDWSFSSINNYNLFERWGDHLELSQQNSVALVSPITYIKLEDLCNRAKRTSDNEDDFWNHQLTIEYNDFIDKLCDLWKLDKNNPADKNKVVSYLQRIHIRQIPDSEMKNLIINWVYLLFIGSPEDIYNTFIESIDNGEMWSKTINLQFLHNYIKSKNIIFRNLSNDDRVKPAIDELNRQYKEHYKFLKGGLIYRKEFGDCESIINSGESVIIHGKAGSGKSGCAQYLASYCEENNIPYIAIRLDHKKPSKNPELWGNELGLPVPLPHSIDSISKNQKAAIIFDQLDALRWTSAHSNDALQVCYQMISQVKALNFDRETKISLILVCRTIDMDHDPFLRKIYEKENDDLINEAWKKIKIGVLDDENVHKIVGSIYGSFSSRLKMLLSFPNNLYIWQFLNQEETYSDCSTTSSLIGKWWKQLIKKALSIGIHEKDMQSAKDTFALISETQGKYSFPRKLMNGYDTIVEFLSSSGFLFATDKSIEFFHQSALDCFAAEKMMTSYLIDNKTVIDVIGSKENQTPFKRYQVQMLLQDLLDSDINNFLNFGYEMLACSDIRFMMKSVFLKCLVKYLSNWLQII